jgi:hypothetical protein
MDEPTKTDDMIAIVRRLVLRELELLDSMQILSDESIDRLAKLALVMQRIKAAPERDEPEARNGKPTDEQLMRKAM